jgi:DmsE family decaheme c-type cytochrome
VRSAKCLACHGDTHPGFQRSNHARAGMACQDCHAIHGESHGWALIKAQNGGVQRPMENVGTASQLCQSCHGEVFAQFDFNERHRLREGILECTSCHDPHEAANRMQLGGFKQSACAECHTDKEGPFIFEHGASRVEGCVACHSPHGSPNRHQLKFQRVAELCFSCHAQVPGFHSRFTLDTVCTNCHSSIHGSNFDAAFLH